MEKLKFIDLFCGIGGFHSALKELGCECVFASDIDKACQQVYENNFGIRPCGDITKVDAAEIPEHDILCGGFPCQPFSKAGKRLGFTDPTEGTLFFEIVRIIKHHQPKFLLLENVRNLLTHDSGNTWKVIHDSLTGAGYNVPSTPIIFSPHHIGVPQHRERVFIMGIRKDIGDIPDFHFTPVQCEMNSILQQDEEIAELSRYTLKPEEIDWIENWNEFIQGIRCEKLPTFPIWTECFCSADELQLNSSMSIHHLGVMEKNVLLYMENKEFIDRWLVKARRNPLFFGAKAKLEWQAGNMDNPDIWKCFMQVRPSGLRVKSPTFFPALVAMTQTSIVGSRKRYLTPRECARLQSFSDTFMLDSRDAQAYKQLGNSVNVSVVKMFAQFLINCDNRS